LFYFPLAPLQVPQQQVERVRRQLDLAERQAQRNQQQKQRAAEDQLRALLPADINDHHAQHAQEQAADAQRLHVADQAHAQAQALDLAEQDVGRLRLVARVQAANDVGDRQEAVGVGEQQQRDGREKQRRRGQRQFHGSSQAKENRHR